MQLKTKFTLLISLIAVLVLSACASSETEDWKVFSIEQEPALNISFRLPPEWLVDFAPTQNQPGQWEILLLPPKCTPDQEFEYQQNCITVIAHIKGVSSFSKEAFIDLTSGDIPLSADGNQVAMLLSQDSYRVNQLNVDEFKHLIASSVGEVEMSTYFIETDSAYYTFITNFPYGQTENEAAENFELLLGSVQETH